MARLFLPEDFDSPREIAEALRRELAAHNLRVVLLAVLSVAATVILWTVLYALAYWLTLLFLTAVRGVDTQVPGAFRAVFWSAAGALLVFAVIDRRLRPDDRPRDGRGTGETVLEFILALPRITLAVWSTLATWQRLSPVEVAQAAAFVDRLSQERRIRLQSVPREIPSDRSRDRILLALQLVQFIDVRRDGREFWVKLNPLRPESLQTPVRG